MSAEAVIAVAREELGYTEAPKDSNMTKYGQEYGMNGQPWCVMFLWWCFRQAGEYKAFFGGGKTASCKLLRDWYMAMGQTVPVTEAQPGDIVILNFSGTKDTQHCGLVDSVMHAEYAKNMCVWTIEGNTTPGYEGSQDNGGCVANKLRFGDQIVAVCRPKYKEEPVKKDDLTGHWAEAACRKAEEKGIMRGYPDGSWAPDKTLTRAELATVLDRLGLLEK